MKKAFSLIFRFWKVKSILVALASLTVLLPSFSGTALAYNRDNAASYADQWALGRNPAYPRFGSDCTNFVSQALVAGGYPEVQINGDLSDDNNWWEVTSPLLYTHSWSVAADQYNFQILHYPGGWVEQAVSVSTDQNAYLSHYDNVNMIRGDELFYDWGNGSIDHMALQVWSGYDQYVSNGSWYGDLQDQHVTDRYHASWNLINENAQWQTTVIYEVHIDDRN